MSTSSKSLRGIVLYSACMCLAFAILCYSVYGFFFTDDVIESNIKAYNSSDLIVNEAIASGLDNVSLSSHDNIGNTENIVIKSSTTLVQDDISSSTIEEDIIDSPNDEDSIAVMILRDADIVSEDDDNIVIYAADAIVEHHKDNSISETEDIVEDDVKICSENNTPSNPITEKTGQDNNNLIVESCVPEHGENSFQVTPEYLEEVDLVSPREPIYIRDKVRNGDTAGKILNAWLSPAEIHNLVEVTNKYYKLSNIRVGRPYIITLDPYDKSFQHFSYEIDNTQILHVSLDKSGALSSSKTESGQESIEGSAQVKKFVAEITGILYDYKLVTVHGTVENSLYGAISNAGEGSSLGALMTDIFGWEVDFSRDIRKGDTFTVLVEKRYRHGEFQGYGRVFTASYVNGGELYEAFRFKDEFGGTAYYDRNGDSLRKAFLKAPLNFTRISSPYTLKRYHPILKKNRPHQGIDYAAPMGTPVKTVGDGVVVFCGWMNGYGNIVRIRHANNIETMYSHLSKFVKNLKKGMRVRQGQVIAYVGSTGLSTGPHLDFRVRKNGEFVNPSTLLNPRSEPVPKKLKAEFAERIKLYEKLQEGLGGAVYMPELVVEN